MQKLANREESYLLHGHDFSNCPITLVSPVGFSMFRKINNRNSSSLLSCHPSRYTFIITIIMFSDTLLWERVQVVSSVSKESTCKEGDPNSIPG